MKKNIISFLVLLLSGSIMLNAQTHSFIKTIEENAYQIVPAQNGTFYTVSWQPNCPNDFIVIRFFNELGEVVHAFQSPAYIGSFNSIDAITNSNNNIVLYLRLDNINHFIYEFDSSGNLVWNNNLQFTNPVIKFTKIISCDSGYFLVGFTYSIAWNDSSQAIITKLSLSGKHKWTKYYRMNNNASSSTRFNDIMLENNTLLCAGRYYYVDDYLGQAPFRPIISMLDTTGTILQTYYYMVDSSMIGFDEYEFVTFEKTPLGKYYLVGNNFGNEHALFKMNENFDIEWIREKLSGKATAMCSGYNEDVFISPDTEYQCFVMQFDSTGEVVANHVVKNPDAETDFTYSHVSHLKKHNCGFLFSNDENLIAHTDNTLTNCLDSSITNYLPYYEVDDFYRRNTSIMSGNLTSLNEYIMTQTYNAITSNANTFCINEFTCDTSSEEIIENNEKIKVFPNPANNYITVTLPDINKNISIQLIDINDKLIFDKRLFNSGIYTFSTSNLTNGMYILKIISNDQSMIKKLIINH